MPVLAFVLTVLLICHCLYSCYLSNDYFELYALIRQFRIIMDKKNNKWQVLMSEGNEEFVNVTHPESCSLFLYMTDFPLLCHSKWAFDWIYSRYGARGSVIMACEASGAHTVSYWNLNRNILCSLVTMEQRLSGCLCSEVCIFVCGCANVSVSISVCLCVRVLFEHLLVLCWHFQ